MKLIKIGAVIVAAAFFSTTASAQIGQCNDTTVASVASGTQFGTVLTLASTACGRQGAVCISDAGASDSDSNRVYAAALTAKASDANVDRVRWDGTIRGCGVLDLPTVIDFRAE